MMNQDQDFSALRNLLALKRLETPIDTEVNRFLIEFHRRQRAELLVPESAWARAMAWLNERTTGFALFPSLSYASAFAAIALTAFLGLSQQVQVTHEDGQTKLAFHMPGSDASFAMLPASFTTTSSPAKTDRLTFTPNRSNSATTRFVLATNSHSAYDATVAF